MRSLDILLTPFWEGNIAYDESVLFLSENGQTPNANLLYPPIEILGVCSSDFEIQYQEGIDWELRAWTILVSPPNTFLGTLSRRCISLKRNKSRGITML